jgi:hypothetical protein
MQPYADLDSEDALTLLRLMNAGWPLSAAIECMADTAEFAP